MATTINNMISNPYGNIHAQREQQEQMRELRNQYKNNEIDSKEYRAGVDAAAQQKADALASYAAAGVQGANNISSLFAYMNNTQNGGTSVWGAGTFDNSIFYESGAELSSLQALNSARVGIEGRARSLVNEIGRDKARGLDVKGKQELLSNLTGNLDILNKNLNSSIERALMTDSGRNSNHIDVIGKLRQALTPKEVEAADEQAAAASAQTYDSSANSMLPATSEESVSEQVVAASSEKDPSEMSAAEVIASNSKSDYAESVNIMAGGDDE